MFKWNSEKHYINTFYPTTVNQSVLLVLWLLSDLSIPISVRGVGTWLLTEHNIHYITQSLRALHNILLTHSFSCFTCMSTVPSPCVYMFVCGDLRKCVCVCFTAMCVLLCFLVCLVIFCYIRLLCIPLPLLMSCIKHGILIICLKNSCACVLYVQ